VLSLPLNFKFFNLGLLLLEQLLFVGVLGVLAFALQLPYLVLGHMHRASAATPVLNLVDPVSEHLLLVLTKQPDEWLGAVPVDGAGISDVVVHLRKTLLVEVDQFVQ
jgi:hypothetical protein